MTILEIFIFSAVQGITEFLPISSSGHLGVLNILFETEQELHLTMELAVHFGTVFAVIIYFWQDVYTMIRAKISKSDDNRQAGILFDRLIMTSIPLIIAGAAIELFFGDEWRNSLTLIGWMTIIFGLLLLFMDKMGLTIRKIHHLKTSDTIILGLAQCIAIIPGVSRSGITMTIARGLGMERSAAAKFSMLMSIPVLLISGGYTMLKVILSDNHILTTNVFIAALFSFLAALIVIRALMLWVRNSSFLPFVIYRIFAGIIILLIGYGVVGS